MAAAVAAISDLRSLAVHIAGSRSTTAASHPPGRSGEAHRGPARDLAGGRLVHGRARRGPRHHRPGRAVRPALYAMRLDPAEMPAPAPVPAPAAARGGVFGDLPSAEVIEATTVESLFYGEEPTVAPSRTWPEAEARAARLMATKAAGGGTGGTVAGWMDLSRSPALAAAQGTHGGDLWATPVVPDAPAWCGELGVRPRHAAPGTSRVARRAQGVQRTLREVSPESGPVAAPGLRISARQNRQQAGDHGQFARE
jgi:hypothetical protein